MLKVLSLFDGISCGKVALDRLGLEINKDYIYYASEIDKNAIKCSKSNHPDIIRIGDVNKVFFKDGVITYEDLNTKEEKTIEIDTIDLLIGGSPCQSFSVLSDQSGLNGKSRLFYEYLRVLNEIKQYNPDLIFLLENVKMKKEYKLNLDSYLQTTGVPICSSLVSYQKRSRFYWSNKPFTIPEDKNISFQSFKDNSQELDCLKLKPECKSYIKMWANGEGNNSILGGCANITNSDKIYCLTTKQDRSPNSGLIAYKDFCRYLTQEELEQAQTLPKGYTSSLSYNQACAVLGNGWTVDIIKHILDDILNGIN